MHAKNPRSCQKNIYKNTAITQKMHSKQKQQDYGNHMPCLTTARAESNSYDPNYLMSTHSTLWRQTLDFRVVQCMDPICWNLLHNMTSDLYICSEKCSARLWCQQMFEGSAGEPACGNFRTYAKVHHVYFEGPCALKVHAVIVARGPNG